MFKKILTSFRRARRVEKENFRVTTFDSTLSTEEGGLPRLSEVFTALQKNPRLLQLIASEVFARHKHKTIQSVEQLMSEMLQGVVPSKSLHYAKMIDAALGNGTFRKISFIVIGGAAEKNLRRILRNDLESKTFESQVEKGQYLNIKSEYGVEWSLEKTSRDIWQNFFDGNNQTLDGIETSVKEGVIGKEAIVELKIKGPKGYDWRELVHLGATTKQESETDAGGFGEGAKILSLILLRDYDAKEVKFAAQGWELEFYLDEIPEGSYTREGDKGLFAKKRSTTQKQGNELTVTFPMNKKRNISEILKGRDLFYSKKNQDFNHPTYDNKQVGGFSILPFGTLGHLYVAGQRMHFAKRDSWEQVENLHVWTWIKTLPKDRDRGMVARDEVERHVLDNIVEAMSLEEAEKAVYDFKEHWDKSHWMFEVSYKLLHKLVDKLASKNITLRFEKEFIAHDLPRNTEWIRDALRSQSNRICPGFMSKIGMTTASERFKEWQSHIRVEANPGELVKMNLLMEAARAIGIDPSVLKDIWLFSMKNEKSIFHGQYNDMFFWVAREVLQGEFLDALHTYVHEAAHKDGPHGNASFDYTLQAYIARIQHFILKSPEKFKFIEEQWKMTR